MKLLLLACILLVSCGPKPSQEARLRIENDSLRAVVQGCQGLQREHQARLDYENINRNPASSWTTDSLTGFLTDPYGVHSQGSRRPQR